jgi:membrane fusion protein (multidrug efflux system)
MTDEKKPSKKSRAIWITTALFIVSGLSYWIYWLGIGQYQESTDDSYVNGNMIMLTPQIDGIITTILADNTQWVEPGQPLIELDKHDYEIAFERAKADLGDAVRSVCQMFFRVEQLTAKKKVAEAALLRAKLDYQHRRALVSDASVSREDFEHSETTLSAAFAELAEADKELLGAIAEVENTSVDTHPKVAQAKANFRKAYLALYRCTVRSPVYGIVTLRKAQLGQWVKAADPLLSLVPLDQIWVDANFREVSLKNLRIGQPVELYSDMYGRWKKFHGRVIGLNPGTGSVFSILPPQNATGNWIKIVQRVPVKISLNPEELKAYPLVLGLSMTAKIDTHGRSGQRLPHASESKPIYSSDVYAKELEGVDALIDEVIAENTSLDL